MPPLSSFTAEPGKRLWAGGIDFLAVCTLFLVFGVISENIYPNYSGWLLFSFAFFAYHFGALLVREGRTLGKTAINVCVISTSGQQLSLNQSLLRAGVRTLPFFLFGTQDPYLASAGAIIFLVLVPSEFYLLEHSLSRQTIADRIANSLVVNLPPLQPHRAPAAPMYSEHDSEFGLPPKKPKDRVGDHMRSNTNKEDMGNDFVELNFLRG